MRWGWLFNRFEDPHLLLSKEQRRRALDASTIAMRRRLVVSTLVIVLPPLMLAAWAIEAADAWVAAGLGVTESQAFMIMGGLVLLAFWPWSAWVYGRMYARPYRRALRELGVPVCVGCGYQMEGLARCPECGWSPTETHA